MFFNREPKQESQLQAELAQPPWSRDERDGALDVQFLFLFLLSVIRSSIHPFLSPEAAPLPSVGPCHSKIKKIQLL